MVKDFKLDLFMCWDIIRAIDEDGLEFYYAYNYQLTKTVSSKSNQCIMPFVYFEDLVNKNDALHVLRTVRMRPKDPYELVEFINNSLENNRDF